MNVTILVLIYNPNLSKLANTISSIMLQKNVSFEIIIADDGSVTDCKDYICDLMDKKTFSNYLYLKNEENQGTVRNYYNALMKASGKYIYAISPGDMLYDEYVISDFYRFSEQNNCKLCFGDAIFYSDDELHTIIESRINLPPKPQIFNEKNSLQLEKTALFFGSLILGVTFFRERESTIRYLKIVKEYAKYVEDNTSAFLAVCDGNRILYYNRNMVWYEYGTGISTIKQSKWNRLLMNDYDNIYNYLKKQYKDDHVVEAAYYDRFAKKWMSILYRIVKHPKISLDIFKIKRMKPKYINNVQQDILNKMFEYK